MIMDDEKLSDAISNLELACHHLKMLENLAGIDPDSMRTLHYSIQMVKESLQVLRGFEVRNEIEQFSLTDDEE